MPEPVAFSDTDERVLRAQHGEFFRCDRSEASVVPDLEYVDVSESPVADQRLQHLTLGISGQECREPTGPDTKDDACVVGRPILDRCSRPDDVHGDTAHGQSLTCSEFAHVVRSDQRSSGSRTP
jgi:hypothetical protein